MWSQDLQLFYLKEDWWEPASSNANKNFPLSIWKDVFLQTRGILLTRTPPPPPHLTAKDKTKREELGRVLQSDLGCMLDKSSVNQCHLTSWGLIQSRGQTGLFQGQNGTHQIQLRQSPRQLPRIFWLVAKVKSFNDKRAEGENMGIRGWVGGWEETY